MDRFDPRVTPARPDLAAAHLQGQVTAERFVQPQRYQVRAGAAAIRKTPAPDAMMTTQAHLGEYIDIYEEVDVWGWGQLAKDHYVGWVDMSALSAPALKTTHRVSALRTYVFSEPDLKSAPHFLASLNSEISAEDAQGKWVRAARAGWVYADHLAAPDAFAADFVSVAETFVGAPYLWGGKESLGLDCSGLVQTALAACGIDAPRDSDMQEAALGAEIEIAADLSGLQRGDFVFWRGHVGIMTDATRLLHANAHHMSTVIEPLAEMVERTTPHAGPITRIRRLLR